MHHSWRSDTAGSLEVGGGNLDDTAKKDWNICVSTQPKAYLISQLLRVENTEASNETWSGAFCDRMGLWEEPDTYGLCGWPSWVVFYPLLLSPSNVAKAGLI